MPVPGQPHRAGTLVALWDDGTLVRAVSDQQVGESYVQGRIGPDQVEAVRSTIDETGILSAKSKGLILDASAIELTIRGENGVQTWGCSPGTPQHDERIIAIQEKLMSLPLSDETSVDAAAYKGYPHDWFK